MFLPQAKMIWTDFLLLIKAGKFLRTMLVPSLPVTIRRVKVLGSSFSCWRTFFWLYFCSN